MRLFAFFRTRLRNSFGFPMGSLHSRRLLTLTLTETHAISSWLDTRGLVIDDLWWCLFLMTIVWSSIDGLKIITILSLLSKMSVFWRFENVKKSFSSHMDNWLLSGWCWSSLHCCWFLKYSTLGVLTAVVFRLRGSWVNTVRLVEFVALFTLSALVALVSSSLHFSWLVHFGGDNFWRLTVEAVDHVRRLTQTNFRQLHHLWLEWRMCHLCLLWRIDQNLLSWILACCCLEQRYFNLHLVKTFGVLRVQLLHLMILRN